MVNTGYWLDRKYSNLEAATAAQTTEAEARAALLGQQAQATPALTGATVARDKAAADLAEAQAGTEPGRAKAEMAQRYGAAGESAARSNLFGAQTQDISGFESPRLRSFIDQLSSSGRGAPQVGVPQLYNPRITSDTPATPIATPARSPQGSSVVGRTISEAHGTERVPGRGSGKKDTQPAMLAPGEAVLNKAAAEHLGRHTIALLNALGEQKMGMSGDTQEGVGATDQGTTQGYAKGTAKVPEKKSAPAGGKAGKSKGSDNPTISPSLLAALMQMGGANGAGGMPAPGGAPMPMPMPQSGGPA